MKQEKKQEKSIDKIKEYGIIFWRSKDSRWLLAVNPAEESTIFYENCVSFCLSGRGIFLSGAEFTRR